MWGLCYRLNSECTDPVLVLEMYSLRDECSVIGLGADADGHSVQLYVLTCGVFLFFSFDFACVYVCECECAWIPRLSIQSSEAKGQSQLCCLGKACTYRLMQSG